MLVQDYGKLIEAEAGEYWTELRETLLSLMFWLPLRADVEKNDVE